MCNAKKVKPSDTNSGAWRSAFATTTIEDPLSVFKVAFQIMNKALTRSPREIQREAELMAAIAEGIETPYECDREEEKLCDGRSDAIEAALKNFITISVDCDSARKRNWHLWGDADWTVYQIPKHQVVVPDSNMCKPLCVNSLYSAAALCCILSARIKTELLTSCHESFEDIDSLLEKFGDGIPAKQIVRGEFKHGYMLYDDGNSRKVVAETTRFLYIFLFTTS